MLLLLLPLLLFSLIVTFCSSHFASFLNSCRMNKRVGTVHEAFTVPFKRLKHLSHTTQVLLQSSICMECVGCSVINVRLLHAC